MSFLELKDVTYRYVTPFVMVDALRGISCDFEKGCLYALRGASGCGKTTLLSLLAGLDLPSDGEVLFEGKSTREIDLDRHRRENTAVIYQSYNLLPQLTVAENVMYPMELNKVKPKDARKKARELIDLVGLTEEEFSRYPSMLSGGQQQRVAIARALGTPAQVILADEPTGNLDAENSVNIITLLRELAHDRGYCVIVVTHDSAVSDLADKVLLMNDGKIVDNQ